MAKCAKCNKLVGKKSPGVQCNKCSKWFHGSCASLSMDQLNALSVTESVDWKCNRCSTTNGGKPKRISVILPDPEDEESEFEMEVDSGKDREKFLFEIRKEVRMMRDTVRDIIREELQSTLHFYSKKIDEYEEKIIDYETRLKLTENQFKHISNLCKNLELRNDILEQKVNKWEQAKLSNEIEICGILGTENENLTKIAVTVGNILHQKPEDIIKVYRKKKVIRQGTARAVRATADAPISVTLREGCHEQWLRASRDTRIRLGDLHLDGEVDGDSKVFLRAALSPSTSYLLWKAKTDLRDKGLCKYVWCREGTVMVRKTDGDQKIYYVRSGNDIDTIKKELQKK